MLPSSWTATAAGRQLRGKSRIEGHRRGKTSVRVIVEMSRKIGIRYLSLYAFSTENWFRPDDEVDALMGLLEHYLVAEQAKMMRYGIRLLAGRRPQPAAGERAAHLGTGDRADRATTSV